MLPFVRVTSKALLSTLCVKEKITSLPLLLISLIAGMKDTQDEEDNYDNLLYTFCPILNAGVAKSIWPGCAKVSTQPRMCKLQVLLHMT